MNIAELSISQLKRAVALKEQIANLEGELASLIGASGKTTPAKKGGMSAAGRAAVAAAQKARWAKIKAAKVTKPAAKPAKKKISAAGIARIKAAQKARWAKIKAAKKA